MILWSTVMNLAASANVSLQIEKAYLVEKVHDDGRGVKVIALGIRPCVPHTVDPKVGIQALILGPFTKVYRFTWPSCSLVVTFALPRPLRSAHAVMKRRDEVWDARQAATTSRTSFVTNYTVRRAMELQNRNRLAAGLTRDRNSGTVTIRLAVALIVCARDTSKSGNLLRRFWMAREDVGLEAASIAHAGSIYGVRIDAVLRGQALDHIEGECDIFRLRRWITLPLLVNAIGIDDDVVWSFRRI